MLELIERRSGLMSVAAANLGYFCPCMLWFILLLSGLKLTPNLNPPDSMNAVVVAAVEGGA